MVGKHVGSLDQRGGEDQSGSGDIGVRRLADRGKLQPYEDGCHGPHKAGFDRLASLKETPDEHCDGGHKAQQYPERNRGRARLMRIGGAIFWPAQHREDNRFEEQQSKARRDSRNGQAALAHRGEHDEVQRDQQGGERHGHAPGVGENGSSLKRASGKEIDGAMGEQQNQ